MINLLQRATHAPTTAPVPTTPALTDASTGRWHIVTEEATFLLDLTGPRRTSVRIAHTGPAGELAAQLRGEHQPAVLDSIGDVVTGRPVTMCITIRDDEFPTLVITDPVLSATRLS